MGDLGGVEGEIAGVKAGCLCVILCFVVLVFRMKGEAAGDRKSVV